MIIDFKTNKTIKSYQENNLTSGQFPVSKNDYLTQVGLEINNISDHTGLDIADTIKRNSSGFYRQSKVYMTHQSIDAAVCYKRKSIEGAFKYSVAGYIVKKSDLDGFINKFGKIAEGIWLARTPIIPVYRHEPKDAPDTIVGYNDSQDKSLFGASDLDFVNDNTRGEFLIDSDAVAIIEENYSVKEYLENVLGYGVGTLIAFLYSINVDWFDEENASEEYVVFPVPCARYFADDPAEVPIPGEIELDFCIPVCDGVSENAIYNMSNILTTLIK